MNSHNIISDKALSYLSNIFTVALISPVELEYIHGVFMWYKDHHIKAKSACLTLKNPQGRVQDLPLEPVFPIFKFVIGHCNILLNKDLMVVNRPIKVCIF